jgi:sodium/proline symporter
MIVTCVVLPIVALFIAAANGIGLPKPLCINVLHGRYLVTLAKGAGFLLVLNGLSWAFGYTGQPQLLTGRWLCAPAETKRARVVAISWTLLAYIGAFLIGIMVSGWCRQA